MHITPTLTPAAMSRWLRMSDDGKELILSTIFCGHCGARGQLRDLVGELHPSGDIMLYGICTECGGKVCRVIETGETMGRADEFP